MPFLGNQPSVGYSTIVKDDFTGNGSTTDFTLSKSVASANDIAVFVGNVRQEPTEAYTVNGTTLTMSAAPSSSDNFYVLHLASAITSSTVPATGTITSGMLTSGSVTSAKLDTNIDIAGTLDVTGALTADSNATVAGNLTVDTNTLYVDATNNRVGIGTSSPSALLDVRDDANGANFIVGGSGTLNVTKIGGGAADALAIYTNGSEYMRIDTNGNVGIGTTNPSGLGGASVNTVTNGSASYQYVGAVNGTKTFIAYGDASQNIMGSVTNIPLIFRTSNTERMRIDSSGKLLIGKTSSGANNIGWEFEGNGGAMLVTRGNNPTCILNRQGGAGDTIVFRFQNSDCGNINVNTNSTAFVTSSDYRLKENVVEVTDGIDRVKLLKPSRFNFIADPNRTLDGFLAHEVSDVVPEAIIGTKDEMDADGSPKYQGIDQSKLVPLLTAALQEAITKIESLETEMITVKSRLDALESA